MRKSICCEYNVDSETVELRYNAGTLIDIDCCLGIKASSFHPATLSSFWLTRFVTSR